MVMLLLMVDKVDELHSGLYLFHSLSLYFSLSHTLTQDGEDEQQQPKKTEKERKKMQLIIKAELKKRRKWF